MKVISGLYKGRNLKGYDINGTRPTMDRIKESLFAMIQDYIKGASVLDLFSGSGSLAIEALSNYAKSAYMVDNNIDSINVINFNVNNLNINNAIVIKNDYKKAIYSFIDRNIKFDIIFLDPPYDTNMIKETLNIINNNLNILNDNCIIICETTFKIDYDLYYNFKIYKEKKYGNKIITILKYNKLN